jgi:UDP-N-acetyl-D-glucosamine dehydrogenase
VLGFDVDTAKVQKLKAGQSYIGHIPAARIAELVQTGRFDASSDPSTLRSADAIIICVPTPLTATRDPDLSFIIGTGRTLQAQLRPGQLVVLESTTYPGTTQDVLLPLLEESGLRGGVDFFLAYSPEREDPGNRQFSTQNIPKVVGGLDATSQQLAVALYGAVASGVIPVRSTQVAEAAKILENTYRAVNIALVNELKVVFTAMGIDVWEVIEAAKTKPFGFQAFYPGPGLGGHCIPIDPFYLTWIARKYNVHTRFIELAGEVNAAMPAYVVQRVAEALNEHGKPLKGSKITLLGMAYKKDVDDPRESPGFEVMELLLKRGAMVDYNDPHIPRLPPMRHYPNLRMESKPLTPAYLASQDCQVILTDHSAYDWSQIVPHAQLVVDTRNATRGLHGQDTKIVRA